MIRTRCPRSESGAVAVIVALLVIVLFAAGALAVDLGNAYTRVRAVQAEADFAALSVGGMLPAKTPAEKLAIADEIARYINAYSLQDDRPSGRPVATGAGLLAAGQVTFPTVNRVVVSAPPVQVDFGMAAVLGYQNTSVDAAATVEVSSLGGNLVMPLYAVEGCDLGQQVLKDRPNGHNIEVGFPPLQFTGAGDTTSDVEVTSVTPATIAADSALPLTVTLTGDFQGKGPGNPKPLVSTVGFFRDTSSPTPTLVEVVPTTVSASSITVAVPASVLDEAVWYVRVELGGEWSVESPATLTVGEAATATCPAASSAGNFGHLGLGDVNNPNDDIAQITVIGPAHQLDIHPGPAGDGICTSAPPPAIHYPADGTNCVRTESGFKPNALTDGLFHGAGGEPGRLDEDTTARCGSARLSTPLGSINNDYLSCFFTDSSTTVQDITSPAYAGGPVLSSDIFSSPRFFYVPTFATEPDSGQSKEYKITGFRPAFLTGQAPTATRTDGPLAGNGLTYKANKVSSLSAVLFSEDALPDTLDSGPPVTGFYSYGPKVVRLVD